MEQLSYGYWLLVGVTVAYVGVAVDFFRYDNWQMAMVFAGYSLANIGLLFASR